MNPNNSQRCGCFNRPQMPSVPCMNTDCHCTPCANPSPTPPPRPPKPPVRPPQNNFGPQASQPGPAMPPLPQPGAPVPPAVHPGTAGQGCGCQTGNTGSANGCPLQMMVGMGYVPWQKWGHTYPVEQGLTRGTIFPDLDFPFLMGRCR